MWLSWSRWRKGDWARGDGLIAPCEARMEWETFTISIWKTQYSRLLASGECGMYSGPFKCHVCFVCRMLQNICNYVICSTEVDFHQCLRRASLIWLLIIIQHLYLSGVWLLVDLKGTPKYMCFKEIGLWAQNVSTISGAIVNIIGGFYMTM